MADGLLGAVSLERGVPPVVASLLAQPFSLLVEDVRDIGLGKERQNADEANSSEDCEIQVSSASKHNEERNILVKTQKIHLQSVPVTSM